MFTLAELNLTFLHDTENFFRSYIVKFDGIKVIPGTTGAALGTNY